MGSTLDKFIDDLWVEIDPNSEGFVPDAVHQMQRERAFAEAYTPEGQPAMEDFFAVSRASDVLCEEASEIADMRWLLAVYQRAGTIPPLPDRSVRADEPDFHTTASPRGVEVLAPVAAHSENKAPGRLLLVVLALAMMAFSAALGGLLARAQMKASAADTAGGQAPAQSVVTR